MNTSDSITYQAEQQRQHALLLKAKAGLVNMATLSVLAWTVGGLIAVFTR